MSDIIPSSRSGAECCSDAVESVSSSDGRAAASHVAAAIQPKADKALCDKSQESDDYTAREELEEYTAQCEERIGLQEKEVLQLKKEIADRDAKISALEQQLAAQAKQLDTAQVAAHMAKQLDSRIAVQETLFCAGLQKMASWLQLFPPYTVFDPSTKSKDVGKYVERIREELQGVYKCVIHVVYAYLHNGQYVREHQEGDTLAVGFFGTRSSNNTVVSQQAENEQHDRDGNNAAMGFFGSQNNSTQLYKKNQQTRTSYPTATVKSTSIATVEFDGTAAKGIFFAPLHYDVSKQEWLDMEEEWNAFVKFNPYGRTLVRIQPRPAAATADKVEFHITEYEMGSGRELVMRRFWKQFDLWRGVL